MGTIKLSKHFILFQQNGIIKTNLLFLRQERNFSNSKWLQTSKAKFDKKSFTRLAETCK